MPTVSKKLYNNPEFKSDLCPDSCFDLKISLIMLSGSFVVQSSNKLIVRTCIASRGIAFAYFSKTQCVMNNHANEGYLPQPEFLKRFHTL